MQLKLEGESLMRNEMFLGGLWLRAECWPENFCIPSFFWSAPPPAKTKQKRRKQDIYDNLRVLPSKNILMPY